MPSLNGNAAGRAYWRSLDELADTPEFRTFVEKEFPSYAPELLHSPTRRQFLKVMGASIALAGGAIGLPGCRWPKENILPFAKQPAGRKPGISVQYATSMEVSGVAQPLLVTSYDGRPIKIEGNPEHPASQGATNSIAQAAILEIYDPDRSQLAVQRGGAQAQNQPISAFQTFASGHFGALRDKRGAGLAVLSEATSSPSLGEARKRFAAAFPEAKWYEFESLSRDNEREGTKAAFGRALRAVIDFDKADVIVSLDSDFLLGHPAAVRYTRDFARNRRGEDGRMSRLFVVESGYSLTGSNADVRVQARVADVAIIAGKLAAALLKEGVALPGAAAGLKATIESFDGHALRAPAVERMAKDLKAHGGHSVVIAGPRQPAAVHALVAVLNEALGNNGKTVSYTAEADADRPTHAAALTALTAELAGGRVETLLILGGNPVYDAPGDVNFAAALPKAKTSIHLSLYNDETSQACTWHVPRAHFLESWGDARAWDGTYSVVQPLIEPLFGGLTPVEILAAACKDEAKSAYEFVRRTFKAEFCAAGDSDEAREAKWRKALELGLISNSALASESASIATGEWAAQLATSASAWKAPAAGSVEIAFAPDNKLYDGRFANNGWLQELPDPLTKLTWDNAALLGPATAAQLGVGDGDLLNISGPTGPVQIAAMIQPGHAPGSITLSIGGGRRGAGRVALGAGFDVNPLRRGAAMHFVSGATVSAGAGTHKLSRTQDHHSIRSDIGEWGIEQRLPQLVREGTFAEYQHHQQEFAKHLGHEAGLHLPVLQSLFKEPEYNGYKWGLAIDLSKCTGCSACVVACQAENNIPVVGKTEVARGREMHWIRIDRYFRGKPEDPQVSHQPVTCQHCENAPCETVCPVGATVHDSDGLNVMVYNRCIGTRYCSNNCPYKVRRYNWFFNHHGPHHPRSGGTPMNVIPGQPSGTALTQVEKLAMNPHVTVRTRGVMEKCTFCTQRINDAKIKHRNSQVQGQNFEPRIPDGEIITACQQACPAEAIIFGDLNDPNSAVRKWQDHSRAYLLLEEQNNQPRLKYLARLRNPIADGAPPADSHGGPAHAAAVSPAGQVHG